MNHAQLLDCTLRDGAYLIDKKFGNATIRGIINGLVKANLDFIEIGFFQDEGFGDGKTVFKNSSDAKRFVPQEKNGCQFTVLADYSRYSIENLDECTGDSIDAVRECFFKKERFDAIEVCKTIKAKGYKVFVQPVDILGYSDIELIEFIQLVNELEPYCLSIVDTFGSMYQEDLHRVFEIINHNLVKTCRIGFHSHNNMQLSNALSQEFIRMTVGKRDIVVDGTINGMGRGAGNTPTELVAQYMVSQLGYGYDIDAILDVIDGYMDNIRSKCTWGYTTPYFVAGCFSAHVNNIAYLTKKNSIRSRDIRYILNKIGAIARKRYDYDLLEKTYVDLLNSDIDDSNDIQSLKEYIGDREVLVIVPGNTATTESDIIKRYIEENKPIVITVNFLHDTIPSDFVYMSNVKRYRYWRNRDDFADVKKIFTSNVQAPADDKSKVISFVKLVKCGWEHLDNSTIMLLRLLDILGVSKISIAGFDGYSYTENNYATKSLELSSLHDDPTEMNKELEEMLTDYQQTRVHQDTEICFITPSRFESCFR